MGIKEYNYEWTRGCHTIFLKIAVELGEMCNSKQCLRMTAGKDWEFKCMSHGKLNLNCSAIDYCLPTLETNVCLLSNPTFFPDRDKITDYSTQPFKKMVRYIYRMLAHILFHHRKLFDLLEDRYRIGERLTLYCRKFNVIVDPEEYCIKI
jgi:hypothetical protein